MSISESSPLNIFIYTRLYIYMQHQLQHDIIEQQEPEPEPEQRELRHLPYFK